MKEKAPTKKRSWWTVLAIGIAALVGIDFLADHK
jgi:hypothetical protein